MAFSWEAESPFLYSESLKNGFTPIGITSSFLERNIGTILQT